MNNALLDYASWRFFNPIIACATCSIPTFSLICNHCLLELDIIPETQCKYCAKPTAEPAIPCHTCAANQPYFDKIYSKFSYAIPLNKLLHQFKYQQNLNHTWALGFLLHKSLELVSSEIDYIIPMPLSTERLKQRGFNQVELLLNYHKTRSKSFKICTNIAKKVIHTPHMSLATRENRHNSTNPFVVRNNLNNKNILIVDDVLTTGTTANHLAHSLKNAGTNRVEVCTLMRTI
jgi:ComF family protein